MVFAYYYTTIHDRQHIHVYSYTYTYRPTWGYSVFLQPKTSYNFTFSTSQCLTKSIKCISAKEVTIILDVSLKICVKTLDNMRKSINILIFKRTQNVVSFL